MKKLLLLAGGAVGYVLGARAGRERYAQIKKGSSRLWRSGPVQSGVDHAETMAKQATSAAGGAVGEAVESLKDAVTSHDEKRPASDNGVPLRPVPTGTAPQEGLEQ